MYHSKLNSLFIIATCGILAGLPGPVGAQMSEPAPGRPVDERRDVGIDPKLNGQLPLDATFKDESGRVVKFGDLLGGKPTVLNFVFYKCTGSCLVEGDSMLKSFKALRFDIGKEYNVVTVSINPTEAPSLALDKKETYIQAYDRKGASNGWRFLVGDKDQIDRLASAAGFRFVYDEKQNRIAHATGIMVLTPAGRLSRYFVGVEYPATELRLALVEASEGKIGGVIDRFVLYCSEFNPITGARSLAIMNILKLVSIMTAVCLAFSITLMSLRHRRIALRRGGAPVDGHGAAGAA